MWPYFRLVPSDPKHTLGSQVASLSAITAASSAMLPLGAPLRTIFSCARTEQTERKKEPIDLGRSSAGTLDMLAAIASSPRSISSVVFSSARLLALLFWTISTSRTSGISALSSMAFIKRMRSESDAAERTLSCGTDYVRHR